MKIGLLFGMLAACLAICYARYKASDFTADGKNYVMEIIVTNAVSHHACYYNALYSTKKCTMLHISYCLPCFDYLQREWKQLCRE